MKIQTSPLRVLALLVLSCLVACGNDQVEEALPPAAADAKRGVPESLAHAVTVLDARHRYTASWAAGRLERPEGNEQGFVRCLTTGQGDLSMLTTESSLEASVDFRGRFPEVQLRVDDVSRLAALELRLMSGPDDFFAFQAPLFGDPAFSPLQNDDWLTLSLSFGEARSHGEPRREAIDRLVVLFRDRGPSASGEARPVALDLRRVRALPHPQKGVVSFTFDDGYDEHFDVAAPLMRKHGFSGTAYVMPDQVGLEGYMTLDELRVLRENYGWEIAAHHFTPFTEMGDALLVETLRGVQRYLEEHRLGDGGQHLAYPLGEIDAERVLPMARRFFTTARLASAGPETLPPGDPHRLRAFNVLSTTTPEEVGAAAKRASRHGEWLILMFHFLVETPELDTAYAIERFERMLEVVAEVEIPVRTVGEVWREVALPATAAFEAHAANSSRGRSVAVIEAR